MITRRAAFAAVLLAPFAALRQQQSGVTGAEQEIPWFEVGDEMSPSELEDFEAAIAKLYRYYVISRSRSASGVTVHFRTGQYRLRSLR